MQLTQIAVKQKPNWSERVARADELAKRCAWASEILRFYRRVLEFQADIYESLPGRGDPAVTARQQLRFSLDFASAAQHLPGLIALVQRHGPGAMGKDAASFSIENATRIVQACACNENLAPIEQFLALAVLQPYAERLSVAMNAKNDDSGRGLCPACDGKPLVSVLRPEGDGSKRWLLCSFCLEEWEFRRILCPYCGEQDNSRLPLFQSEGDTPAVSVHACMTCRRYVKAVDTTVDGYAVPIVDEIAHSPLDVWAVQQGYQKLQPNLLGF